MNGSRNLAPMVLHKTDVLCTPQCGGTAPPHPPPTAPSPPAFAGAVQYRLQGRPVGPSKPPYHRKRRMVPLCVPLLGGEGGPPHP